MSLFDLVNTGSSPVKKTNNNSEDSSSLPPTLYLLDELLGDIHSASKDLRVENDKERSLQREKDFVKTLKPHCVPKLNLKNSSLPPVLLSARKTPREAKEFVKKFMTAPPVSTAAAVPVPSMKKPKAVLAPPQKPITDVVAVPEAEALPEASPDQVARDTIKVVDAQVKAFDCRTSNVSPEDFASALREKYVEKVLGSLPTSPMVHLARKKCNSKIASISSTVSNTDDTKLKTLTSYGNELKDALRQLRGEDSTETETTVANESSPVTAEETPVTESSPVTTEETPVAAEATPVTTEEALPTALQQVDDSVPESVGNDEEDVTNSENPANTKRQEVLNKLLKLSPEQLQKLPKAQQDLVAHTKRYRQMLSLTDEQIASLPMHQQQVVMHFRNQIGKPVKL